MPYFSYSAFGRDGQTKEGQEFANSRAELERRLKLRKQVLIDCAEIRAPRTSRKLLSKLVMQLSPLLNNGIVIDRALQIVAEDGGDEKLSAFAVKLRDSIKKGQQLSESLEQTGIADGLALSVIRAGEASGELPAVMQTLETHYLRRDKFRQEITGALFYPAILVFLSVVSIIVLGIYVIPTFKDLFQDRMDKLPWNVKFIFGLSDLIVHQGFLLFAFAVAVVGGIYFYYKRSANFQYWWDARLLSFPAVGKFLGKIYATNFLSVLAVQLRNGVPMISALELAATVTSNRVFQGDLAQVQNEVRRGRNLSGALAAVRQMPQLPVRYITIGEETGTLSEMVEKASNQLGDDIANRSKTAANLLGPIIILVMGLMIAFIVVSMLLAVYSLTDISQ